MDKELLHKYIIGDATTEEKEDVARWIDADEANMNRLPKAWSSKADYPRPTYYAAESFLGQAYLFQGDYSNCITALKDVINNSGKKLVDFEHYSHMQHLVASTSIVKGEGKQKIQLPIPQPRKPFFGTGNFTDEMKKHWEDYYKDVAVLAFPTPKEKQLLNDSDEKALYYRAPYSSQANVKQFLPTTGAYDLPTDSKAIINKNTIIDLTQLLQPGGTIEWNVPEGS